MREGGKKRIKGRKKVEKEVSNQGRKEQERKEG